MLKSPLATGCYGFVNNPDSRGAKKCRVLLCRPLSVPATLSARASNSSVLSFSKHSRMPPMTEDDHHLDKLVLSLTRRAYPDDDHAMSESGCTGSRVFELVRPVSRARRRLSICRVSCKTCLAFFRHDGLHRPNRAKGARVARDKLLAWSLRASVTTRSFQT